MGHRRSFLALLATAWVCWSPEVLEAADKAGLACIQASDEGQTARDAGNLLRARELLAQCAAPKCPAMIRRDCTSWLEEVQRHVPTVVLGAHDSQGHDVMDAKVSVDGEALQKRLDGTPLELNPGPHVVRWEAPGAQPIEMRVVLRADEKDRPLMATLEMPRAPVSPRGPGVPSRPDAPGPTDAVGPAAASSDHAVPQSSGLPAGAYVVGGAGIVALGVFGYFGYRGKHDADKLKETCAPDCQHADVEAARTKLRIADFALGVGVVGLAVATWIGVSGKSAPPRTSWDMTVTPLASGAQGRVRVAF